MIVHQNGFQNKLNQQKARGPPEKKEVAAAGGAVLPIDAKNANKRKNNVPCLTPSRNIANLPANPNQKLNLKMKLHGSGENLG